ncbi:MULTISPECIES: MarR family winged helix-turn-helix transcriptional regulator [unclassified Streptomyces]|uniref:MarR family winged helix-turn-helix transcriptional regulator n=1 Tax=unclassified Streptomyces TaxID=2593676 RepID=UPI002DDB9D4B|nr:MarR family winged helix-turn-helix transcriptional regulator [Streptomyces sp. NBC_01237]WRZ70691.1 MarR family winged helix-turn-helix transcriptional regulator [Streptomyces sp. NBC_01237]
MLPDSPGPSPRTPAEIAATLTAVLPVLLRAADRRVEKEYGHPKPSEGQLALLRLVTEQDGITVRQAAETLLMKPNNVSAMVSQLSGEGLMERRQDPADRRVAHLHSTERARAHSTAVDALFSTYVEEGLRSLGDDDVASIARALPALSALARQVRSAAS